MDRAIVGDVVTKVPHRRWKDGRDPDRVHTEIDKVVKAARNPFEIANAIRIRILKRSRIDLVNDPPLPPSRLFHGNSNVLFDAQPGSRAWRECGGRRLNRDLRPDVASQMTKPVTSMSIDENASASLLSVQRPAILNDTHTRGGSYTRYGQTLTPTSGRSSCASVHASVTKRFRDDRGQHCGGASKKLRARALFAFVGVLMLTVLGGLAEFERELIRARTGEGRERAKARG